MPEKGVRWLFLTPPPGASAQAGWALLPLRAFLACTFIFAGLEKLANPNFFSAANPSGIQAQMIASARFSPLHMLIGHLLGYSVIAGIVIAVGEVAVGLGALLGLWTRVAALGGMALSFMLFLTVSFHSSPYYTGADIVFLFAWTPLLVAGAGGVLSLDAVVAAAVRRKRGFGSPVPVPLPFSEVQRICGNYDNGDCQAQHGAHCEPRGCPFLAGPRDKVAKDREVARRTVVVGGTAAVLAAAATVVIAGLAAGVGRLVGGAKPIAVATGTLRSGTGASRKKGALGATGTNPKDPLVTTTQPPVATTTQAGRNTSPVTEPPATTTPTTTAAEPTGTAIGPASDVPVGGSARFDVPTSGDPGIILQPSRGRFLAYDAVCPHAGCTVAYSSAAGLIVCPCHGSEFTPETGGVEAGPSPRGLTSIQIAKGTDGQLYVS